MSHSSDEKQQAGNTLNGQNSRHILLLDDEKAVRVALSRLLKARGHRCSAAATGEILLDIFERSRRTDINFDLAILDIKILGGMGGIETMQKMKQIDNSIPIMSMSGNPADTLFKGDEASGFVTHLEKPFSAEHLSFEIERICSGSSQADIT